MVFARAGGIHSSFTVEQKEDETRRKGNSVRLHNECVSCLCSGGGMADAEELKSVRALLHGTA